MIIKFNGKQAAKRRQELIEKGELMVATNPAQKVRNLETLNRKPSAHQAIKAKCWECMGGSADEWDTDTRKSIRECTSGPNAKCPCPLYAYRPYT